MSASLVRSAATATAVKVAKGLWRHYSTDRTDAVEVADGVRRIGLSIVNAYLIDDGGGSTGKWALVDAGLSTSFETIRQTAEERFGRSSPPVAIVLTHGHFDHVGSVARLMDHWRVPVYCHPLELPYVTGRSSYPPPDPTAGGGMMSLMSPLYPRGPIDLGGNVHTLPENGSIPGLDGWQWIHTPGHTAGHVSLFRESDRTLIAGDAFVTTAQESAVAVATRETYVHRPPAYYTVDWDAARDSVERLAALRPEIAATGHGLPMRGDRLRKQLGALVERWEDVARPRFGRYSHEPAVAGVDGVIHVPKSMRAVQTAWWAAMAGVGAAALMAATQYGRRRMR